jgi:hypothetical protein
VRKRTSLGASAGLGALTAALVIAVKPATPPLPPVPAGTAYAPPITEANNKRPLSAAERLAMFQWADRVRGCAHRHGLPLHPLRFALNEFVLVPLRKPSLRRLSQVVGSCASAQGGPPTLTSLVVERDHAVHFYKPRACLLPIQRRP